MVRKVIIILTAVVGLTGCSSATNSSKLYPKIMASTIENRTDIRPIVLVEPKYPSWAIKKGIEGFCKVSFDLVPYNEKYSQLTNLKALECSPKKVFIKSCLSAVAKWKFRSIKAINTDESPNGIITSCHYSLG